MFVRSVRTIRERRGAAMPGVIAIALVATLAAASPAPAAAPCTSPPATFPTSQMTPGTMGVGYTVIQGTTIVPFDVELLGVMPNAIFLGVDIVVARIVGPASFLAVTGGAAAGMSGSPIYVGGRLAGALAWAIANDRHIFGMTAAEDMVGMLTLPGADGEPVPAALPLTSSVRRAAAASGVRLDSGATLEQLPVPLGVSGLAGLPLADIEAGFTDHGLRVQAFRTGSVTAPTPFTIDPTPFAPGAGLGVALSYGDVSQYGFGTATAVCGGVVLGFGHPMFSGSGRVSLGMNAVDVLAMDNGALWGTKIGTLTAAHGAMTRDGFAGVTGAFGLMPAVVPITSEVSSPDTGLSRHGETDTAWDQDWFVADTAAYHAWSNLTYVAQQDAPGTLRLGWTITGTREDGSPFTVSNRLMSYGAYGAAYETSPMTNALYALAFNGSENIAFTSIEMTGEISESNLTSTIARVRVSSPAQPSLKARSVVRARPGDVVTIEITYDPVDGDDVVATTSIKVPRHAHGSEPIRLSGGRGRDRYPGDSGSLDDLIALLNGGGHKNDLIVSGFGHSSVHEQNVIVKGGAGFTVKVI
jgi:hypothetical protein